MYLIISRFIEYLCIAISTFSGSISITVEIAAITIISSVMVHAPMIEFFAMVIVYQKTASKNTFTSNN